MSWLSSVENGLGSAFSTVNSTISSVAKDTHEVLGSGGTIYANGQPIISTGVTKGDITGTNTSVSGTFGSFGNFLSNPFVLIGGIVVVFILVIKK
jgi:hypothetical protein